MSVIHVRHIQNHLEQHFLSSVDLEDVGGREKAQDHHALSRALAAYAIQLLSQASIQDSCHSITDGTDDNGIDAIYIDPTSLRIYVVQSKWIQSGSGEPSVADVKKFRDGVADLINLGFQKFGQKVQAKRSEILQALNDPSIKMSVVLAYTGVQTLADPAMQCLEEFVADLNDANEIVELHILHQSKLHRGLTVNIHGEPIKLEVNMASWGKRQHPHPAWYGQVAASDIADWWHDHRERLFTRNLRGLLADNEINTDIRNTLLTTPDYFWYFNNGITLVAGSISRPLAKAGSNESVRLECNDVSVVNGAQTVGTIGRFAENPANSLANSEVPVRIIELGEAGSDFGTMITRTNNRQNKIESRDFVALDDEQQRIQQDLALDGISYQLLRNADFRPSSKSFDVSESTIALACATGDGTLAVQLKREIGKLWEDLSKPPYRRLFNKSISGTYVWRCVQMQREIDNQISSMSNSSSIAPDARGILVHGNRILSALVFTDVDKTMLNDINTEFDIDTAWVAAKIGDSLAALSEAIQAHYSRVALSTLFKNASKCRALIDYCKDDDSSPFVQMALSFDNVDAA
ncbi:MAG: AIPR family protein [Pseudomonadota bacterium]